MLGFNFAPDASLYRSYKVNRANKDLSEQIKTEVSSAYCDNFFFSGHIGTGKPSISGSALMAQAIVSATNTYSKGDSGQP